MADVEQGSGSREMKCGLWADLHTEGHDDEGAGFKFRLKNMSTGRGNEVQKMIAQEDGRTMAEQLADSQQRGRDRRHGIAGAQVVRSSRVVCDGNGNTR